MYKKKKRYAHIYRAYRFFFHCQLFFNIQRSTLYVSASIHLTKFIRDISYH